MYCRWSHDRTLVFWMGLTLLAFTYIWLVDYFSVLSEKTPVTPIGANQTLAQLDEELSLNQRPGLFHKSFQRQLLLPTINLAVVSCGIDKLEEAVTMIKSALLFSHGSTLRIFAFADNTSIILFQKYIQNLQKDFRTTGSDFIFEMKLATFPSEISGMTQSWSTIFKPCGTLRLFLPRLLPDIDSLIYLDADVVILSNLTNLWNHFENMNSSQLIGLSYYVQTPLIGNRVFRKHEIPVFANLGLNCGIALMNLTKMRLIDFEEKIYQVRKDFEHLRPNSTGDQFLQNILYGQHPEYVFVLPCDWNFRMLQCNCRLNEHCECRNALIDGVSAIHGTLNAFSHKTQFPFFRHIYEIVKVHSFRMDSMSSLLEKLQTQFELEEPNFPCFFNSSELFYSKFKKYVVNHAHL